MQKMVFQCLDSGLFYLSNEEKEQLHHGQTWLEMQENRKHENIEEGTARSGCYSPLYRLHVACGPPGTCLTAWTQNKCQKAKKKLPRWEGTPKGILQILWEHGLIAESSYKNMTLDSQKNPLTGQIDNSTSLWYLLGQCTDFENELSALQAHGKKLDMVVNATPKFHDELAGKGIEYSWGHAKGMHCWTALLMEKQGEAGQEQFFWLVENVWTLMKCSYFFTLASTQPTSSIEIIFQYCSYGQHL